jgi:transcriptional regulator with XRE-family HTH domain
MSTIQSSVGDVMRQWRHHRHVSQLDLANVAGVSPRHLSFIESGRSQPSREMLQRLADGLDIPLRARNALFVAGGYAPVYPERSLSDPALEAVRRAVELVLAGHEPYPALAVDRVWNLQHANQAAWRLLGTLGPGTLPEPVNVLRLCFDPAAIGARLRNRDLVLPQLIARLEHEIAVTADTRLEDLRAELLASPVMADLRNRPLPKPGIVLQFDLESPAGILRFITTTTVFGTAADITVDELTIETFFPADDTTASILRDLADM